MHRMAGGLFDMAHPRKLSPIGQELEVEPHHDASERGPGDLPEPGRGEDAPAAHVQLAPGDLLPRLGDHRVPLERAGAALSREADRGGGKTAHDSAAPELRASDEAGDRPDAVVVLVLAAFLPRDAGIGDVRVGGAPFYGT